MSGLARLVQRGVVAVVAAVGLLVGLLVSMPVLPSRASAALTSAHRVGRVAAAVTESRVDSAVNGSGLAVSQPNVGQSVSMVHDGAVLAVARPSGVSAAAVRSAGSRSLSGVHPETGGGSSPATQFQGPDWTPQLPLSAPSARDDAGLAFDAARGVDVLFGGYRATGGVGSDTWTWNGSQWSQLSPSSSPSARGGMAMTYDPALSETVLFGGYSSTGAELGDTWAWNGSTWSQLSPTTSPPALEYASMAYDTALGELVLFGGQDASGVNEAGTWTFNGTTWARLSPSSSPSGRSGAAMAYDSTSGTLVLFGGTNSGQLDDTWTFNGSTWTQQSPYASPADSENASMVYDAALGGVVVFGGQTSSGADSGQTYFWNATTATWELVYNNRVPLQRAKMMVAQAATNGQLLLFGGTYGSTLLSDTQIYDWGHNGASTGDATATPVPLGDQGSATVDLGTGNLYVAHRLWNIAGTGLASSAYDFYNSESAYGFNSVSANISVLPNGDVIVNNVNGTVGTLVFTKTGSGYASPAGSEMTLAYNSSAGTYTVTMNSSQIVYTFNATYFGLESIADRNGDTVSVAGEHVADDRGRTVTGSTSTSGSNTLTTWTDSGLGRTWVETVPTDGVSYSAVTDAAGKTTDYDYNPSGQMDEIVDPDGNITTVGYDSAGRVDSLTRVTNTSNMTGPTTTFTWQSVPAGTLVPAGTTAQDEVVETDPDGHATTYVDDYAGQAITVTDALGHREMSTFSPDRDPQVLTNALTEASTLSYNANNSVIEASEPASGSGQTASSTYLSYATPGASKGATYLPSSAMDGEGNCDSFTYDANGNPTASYQGLTPTSGTTNCDGKTSGTGVTSSTNAYQGDGSTNCGAQPGELCTSTDGNGHATTYSYDSHGQVTSISGPGGSCAAGSRNLCTSYTYDADSRPITKTTSADPTAGPIAMVQSATTNFAGNESSATVSLPSNVTAGDALVLMVGSDPNDGFPTVSTVSGGGVTWTVGASGGTGGAGDDELWYGLASTGGSGTVTVTMSANYDDIGLYLAEFSGVAATAALDTHGTSSGTTAAAPSPTLTTTTGSDLVVMAVNTYNTISATPGSPWTDVSGPEDGGAFYNQVAYRTNVPAGTVSTSWTQNAAASWNTVGIALKPGPSTAGTIAMVQSATTNFAGNESSATVSLPSNVTAGDALVLMVGSDPNDGFPTVSSVSGGGVTWSVGASGGTGGAGDNELWYGLASSGGSGTVTVTMSANYDDIGLYLAEFSGVAATAALDTHGTNSGTTAAAPSPTLTTTTGSDLVVMAVNTYNTISATPGSPWTDASGPQDHDGNIYNQVAYRTNVPAGATSTSWTQSSAASWNTVGIALKPVTSTTSYSYDNDDRITQVLTGGMTTCVYTSGDCVTYGYDADGNVTARTDATGTTTYTYDTLGRLTNEALPSGANACPGSSPASIVYGYDAASNLTSYCDAGGTVTYAYDAANRMIGVATGTGSCTAGSITQPCSVYAYNNANQLTSITFPTSTGVAETFGHNNAGNITSAAVTGGTATAGTTSYTYTSGTNDRPLIQTAASSASGITTTYTYNGQEELTAANTGTASSSDSYTYDADGNMLTENLGGTVHTMTYNSADQLCWAYTGTTTNTCASAPSGAVTYAYDPDGNQLTSTAGETNSYNPADQTTSMTSPTGGTALSMAYTGTDSTQRTAAGTTTFTNNTFGVASSTVNGATTYFTRDPSGRLNSMLAGGNRYYYLYDGAGSVIGLINSSGAQVASYTYNPYGTTLTATGSEAAANPFRYEAGYTDTTGYIKYGTRYYNPAVGSWTQLDPSGQNGGYVYAGSNPTNASDPTGQGFFADVVGAVVGTVASVVASAVVGPIFGGAAGGCIGGATTAIVNQESASGELNDCGAGAALGAIAGAVTTLLGE